MPRVRLLPAAPDSAESRSGRVAVLELPLAGRRRAPGSGDGVGGRGLGVPSAFGPRGSLVSARCRRTCPPPVPPDLPAAGLETPPICGRRETRAACHSVQLALPPLIGRRSVGRLGDWLFDLASRCRLVGKALGSPRNQPLRARRGRDVARGDGVRGGEPALSQPRESPGEATASRGPSEPPGRAGLLAVPPLPAGIPPLPAAGTPGLSRAYPAPPVGDFWGRSSGGFSLHLKSARGTPPQARDPGPSPRAPDALPRSSLIAASPRVPAGGQRRTDMPGTRLRPAGSPRGR